MNLVTGIPNVYPQEFEKQFYERMALIDGISHEELIKKNQDLLKEPNTKIETRLQDSIVQKINSQIKYWMK